MRYVHTNLIARDWKKLVAFYVDNLDCVAQERYVDLEGPDVERGTGVSGAHITGRNVRLPGYGEGGPTIEIFSYDPIAPGPAELGLPVAPNRPGFGHLAFEVDDVEAKRQELLAAGGSAVGDVVSFDFGASAITWCYVTDPEGNIIELQRWSRK